MARPRLPPNRMWYWKMCVSSWRMSSYSSTSGRSIGRTMRNRAEVANAATPSGMKLMMTLFWRKSECVL